LLLISSTRWFSCSLRDVAIPYPSDTPFQIQELTHWVGQHSSLTYQMPGTLQAFDALAAQFLAAEGDAREAVVVQAQEQLENEQDEGSKAAAEYYVKVMAKVSANGFKWVTNEAQRQTRLLDDASKLTKAGRRKIEHQLNILAVWAHSHADAGGNPLEGAYAEL
jgi:hypothetical protein